MTQPERRHPVFPKIRIDGDPILYRRARIVEDVNAPEVQDAIRALHTIMDQTGAMGFAAPQLGIDLQIFIFSSSPHLNHEDAPIIPRTVVINPTIIESSNPRRTWEKCYSLPGIRGHTVRNGTMLVSYTNAENHSIDRQVLEGFPADLFGHEYDHLQGTLYTARETDTISDEEYKKRFSGTT